MTRKRHSHKRVKRLRTYNVTEAAATTGATSATVRLWLKGGLKAIPDCFPLIIRGADLINYLRDRAKGRKHPCGPGRLFCLSCKQPKRPAFGEVEFVLDGHELGTLIGLCPQCSTVMRRRSSRARLYSAVGDLTISAQRP